MYFTHRVVLALAALLGSACDSTVQGQGDAAPDATLDALADGALDAADLAPDRVPMPDAPQPVDAGDTSTADAGPLCGAVRCNADQECCASSVTCTPIACDSCCRPEPPDSGLTCGTTMCTPDQACCAATGVCYDPRCLSCCMSPARDAGPPRPDAARACTDTECAAIGQVCCLSSGTCYDSRCLACCR